MLGLVSIAFFYFSRANNGVGAPTEHTGTNSDVELQSIAPQPIEVDSSNIFPQAVDAPNLEPSHVSRTLVASIGSYLSMLRY